MHKRFVGNAAKRRLVSETLLLLPPQIKTYVAENVWFFTSAEDAWAYTFDGNDLKNKHFIYLSDELFDQNLSQIQYTILHEIGHVILKHKNAIDRKQTKSEVRKQEEQADSFAQKYLNN